MRERTHISRIWIIGSIVLGVFLASAKKADTRFQWSYDKFAAQCGFTWADYHKAHSDFLTDHDYSGKWVALSLAKFKSCDTCYRTAEVTTVNSVRVAQMTLSSESGDWYHFISYCFDAAGKLQAVNTVYNSTQWSYVAWYSYSGALQLQEERWQDLMSGKKIAKPEGAGEFEAHRKDIRVYKDISELPFAKLMTK